jgi:hypothetical protein
MTLFSRTLFCSALFAVNEAGGCTTGDSNIFRFECGGERKTYLDSLPPAVTSGKMTLKLSGLRRDGATWSTEATVQLTE